MVFVILEVSLSFFDNRTLCGRVVGRKGHITPTHEFWAKENVLFTEWFHPLSPEELTLCFNRIARMIDDKPGPVQVLFDLRRAQAVPAVAAIIAIHSGFLSRKNTGAVAVISTDVVAETLANISARVARHEIRFFPDEVQAWEYLNARRVEQAD